MLYDFTRVPEMGKGIRRRRIDRLRRRRRARRRGEGSPGIRRQVYDEALASLLAPTEYVSDEPDPVEYVMDGMGPELIPKAPFVQVGPGQGGVIAESIEETVVVPPPPPERSSTLKTVLVFGGLAVVGYLIYEAVVD